MEDALSFQRPCKQGWNCKISGRFSFWFTLDLERSLLFCLFECLLAIVYYHLHECARATITKYHEVGGMNHRNVCSHSSQGWMSKIERCQQGSSPPNLLSLLWDHGFLTASSQGPSFRHGQPGYLSWFLISVSYKDSQIGLGATVKSSS